ncbi:unnamed protein product [Mytilus coruscus]|uniref:Uncharacterized protein n=1 Tax=Mytilus coruscus TaxID=42192 RepID=A0A6J8ES34_MYTCO|nr:unnamed protein product [Mytilus coruscus]
MGNTYVYSDMYANDSHMQGYYRYDRNTRPIDQYRGDELTNDYSSNSGRFASNLQTHFAPAYHNQTLVGNIKQRLFAETTSQPMIINIILSHKYFQLLNRVGPVVYEQRENKNIIAVYFVALTVMTTASNMNFTTASLYYVHCIKTRSSIINDTITTPFWSNKTTTSDTLSSMNETSELGIMVSMIGVMFMMIILYAAVCRLFSSEKYAQALAQGKQPDRNLEYTIAYLTLVEATVESTPQLTIQIYLSITNTHTETTQTQNAAMLYLWYSDDPALLKIKIYLGGACSNHEWYAPYIFVVVIVGFVVQPSFLLVYYRLRKKQHKPKDTNTSE